MQVIVCGSETEISIVTQQHLAVSALVAKVDGLISSGAFHEKDETDLRCLVAHVRAAFKMPSRRGTAFTAAVAAIHAEEKQG